MLYVLATGLLSWLTTVCFFQAGGEQSHTIGRKFYAAIGLLALIGTWYCAMKMGAEVIVW